LLKQFFRQLSRPKTEIKISFGPALTANDGNELKEKAQDWINNKIDDMHLGWGSHFDLSDQLREKV